jgi:hypothetical protein
MKRFAILGLAVALASSTAGASFAQGGPGGGAIRAACGADMAKLCPDAAPGDARRQCMMAHMNQVSDACKSAIAARRAAGQTSSAPHN